MILKIIGPAGHEEERAFHTQGMALGALLPKFEGDVWVNGTQLYGWASFIPGNGDRIEIRPATADFGIISGPLIAAGVSATVASAISSAVVSLVISAALSGIMRALTPKPKKPKLDSNQQQAFGIGGFSNTKGRGTPAFVPYGVNKINGHVISSGATLSPDGKSMWGRILYFMGDTGGDGIQSISQVKIDSTDVAQYPDIVAHTRLGTNPQAVIPEFENRDELYTPPVSGLDFNPETQVGTPIIYTTHGDDINRATLFFSFPGGLYTINSKGKHRFANVNHLIEIKRNSESIWQEYARPAWSDNVTSGVFKTWQIDFPSADKWDIRVRVTAWFPTFDPQEPFIGDSLLFSVQETKFTTKTYPGWALLGLTNIPSKQVQSLENLNVSAIVEGKRCKRPLQGGGYSLEYTRKRCWIVRDMMTHPVVGMGSEIEEWEIDELVDAWTDAQNYYDEIVTGHAGALEVRDFCDFILNDSDWDWEWVKKVAGEARGRIVPSGKHWKYVIDRPDDPNLLYTEGANIIEGSISQEISPPDKPFTEISGQFRDADKDYEENFSPPISDPEAVSTVQEQFRYDTITRESEVQRENMIVFKRNFLERRRWSFLSPMGAIVSEPMDLDYFGERGIGNEGAYGGILPAGATTTDIALPMVATLKVGSTYALIVKHRNDNTTEYRTVSTAAGNWGLVTVSSPFVALPAEGDTFSLGVQDVEHIITRAQDLEIDREGRVKQIRSEYIPAVYTQDPLPPKSIRRFFRLQDRRLPLPLWDAQVREEINLNKDGSISSILIFDVTPGLPSHSGQAQGGNLQQIILSAAEPARDNFYKNALLSIIAGTGSGQTTTITDYFGPSRVANVQPFFATPPDGSSLYVVQWPEFADYLGVKIEQSDDGVNFTPLVRVEGTHWEMDGRGAGPGIVYFRFTPFAVNGTENNLARIVQGVTLVGDLSAPAPPISVTVTSYLLTVRVAVVMQKPVAEDFSGVEIQIWRLSPDLLLDVARFGAPADSTGTGTMLIEATFNLGARTPPETVGTTIWASAASVDYSNNKSAFVGSSTVAVLSIPAEIGGGVEALTIPVGLTLSTGVQIDPVDGVTKAFLDISWIANPPGQNVQFYEVQYRPVGAVFLTDRMISHPQISTREIGVTAGLPYEARIQAIRGQERSGFSGFVSLVTAFDTVPPGLPTLFNVIGGFRMLSVSFGPPADIDYDVTELYIINATIPNSPFSFWQSAKGPVVSLVGLADDTTYFVYARARDFSGNVSALTQPLQATTVKIGPNDVVTTNLITQTAQISQGIINDAHIQTLAANKITTGQLNALFTLGVGANVFIDGPNAVIAVGGTNTRVQLGKLGPGINDYGLQIFGADGSLWHSFTSGTQSKGRQDQNVFTQSVTFPNSETGADVVWINGVLVTTNSTTTITVRVKTTTRSGGAGKGSQLHVGSFYKEYTVVHGLGKTMAVSPSLNNIFDGDDVGYTVGSTATATLLLHYW